MPFWQEVSGKMTSMRLQSRVYPLIVTPPGGAQFAKKKGQSIGATIKFTHKGVGGTALIRWGIAPGSSVPLNYNEQLIAWIGGEKSVLLTEDVSDKVYTISLSGVYPDILPVQELILANAFWNGFDCYVDVTYGGKVELYKWWNDVYTRSDFLEPGVVDFRDLTAVFS